TSLYRLWNRSPFGSRECKECPRASPGSNPQPVTMVAVRSSSRPIKWWPKDGRQRSPPADGRAHDNSRRDHCCANIQRLSHMLPPEAKYLQGANRLRSLLISTNQRHFVSSAHEQRRWHALE